MDHITITVNGTVVYDSVTQIARTPPAAPADPANPFVAWRAQHLSIYDIIAPAMLGRYLTPAELEQAAQAGYDVSDFAPRKPEAGPAFDPHKTVLDVSDAGGLFEPAFGRTIYTITGPLRVFLVIDGTEVLSEKASLSVDYGLAQDATVNGTQARLGPGRHTVVVVHNVTTGRVRLSIQ